MKMKFLSLTIVGIFAANFSAVSFSHAKNSDHLFVKEYTNDALLNSSSKREDFVKKFLNVEANFLRPGVGYNALSGLTYDGRAIDFDTGELKGFPKNWSAASKESLHVMILALAVNGHEYARIMISPDNPRQAKMEALSILEKKINSYDGFHKKYPGFGGFLPWFVVTDRGMETTWDWEDRAPALDNGQLAWALVMASQVLKEQGELELAKRYKDRWRLMAKNSVPMFLDTTVKKIRGTTKIKNTKGAVKTSNYSNDETVYHITDPYEGELMTLFMTLYGKWESPVDVISVWQSKNLEKTVYKTNEGHQITVRKGFWYSVHEMWNFLVLPYLDDPLINQVFINGEKARSWYSAENKIPGLLASVNEPVKGNMPGVYLSALGIPSLAQVSETRQDVVAPYGSFPMIMADRSVGVSWLRTMIAGPSMMGPYGATEAASIDGTKIAPLLTWDGKMTTVLALIGQSHDVMRRCLKATKKYKLFKDLLHEEYARVFGEEIKEAKSLSFRTPTAEIPRNLPDFDVARKITDVLHSGKFDGYGDLKSDFTLTDESLQLGAAKGYLWTMIQPTDMRTYRFINFDVRQEAGHEQTIDIELKNKNNQLITDGKIRIKVPYTGASFEQFSIDISALVTNPQPQATIFVFADPEGSMEFRQTTISARLNIEYKLLSFNSRSFTHTIAVEAKTSKDSNYKIR